MANIKSAKKRVVIAERNRVHNVAKRSEMRTAVKKVINLCKAGDKEAAKAAFARAEVLLDRAATKGLIHINKAARHKSNLSNKIKALG